MKILIVDDSKTILKLSSRIITNAIPSSEVLAFDTPSKAIEALSSGASIDLAFLDYNMEGMNGLELAQAILKIEPSLIPNKNICIVSANIQEAVVSKAKELGIDFMEKPFDDVKLKSFLKLKGYTCGA